MTHPKSQETNQPKQSQTQKEIEAYYAAVAPPDFLKPSS